MSKIVQAVNAMISHKNLITHVAWGEREIFFLYKGRHKWSMRKDADDYYLWYYPGTEEIEQLTHFGDDEWEGTPMVSYRASELGTKEADASFAELYSVLKERIYGMNDVLDDIISEDDN